jgi:hypothetical protein
MFPLLLRFTLLIGILAVSVGGLRISYRSNSQNIALKPLPLDPAHPGQRRIGPFLFLNAWELGSGNSDFGGISALTALGDGRFIGLSDAGTVIGFGLNNNTKTDRPFIAPLPTPVTSKDKNLDRDTEGIAYDAESKRFWVSYEGNHAIRRFTSSLARTDAKSAPMPMRKWGANKGGETIIRLQDGRFLVFSESAEMPDGSYMALLFSGDPVEKGTRYSVFGYRPPDGYMPTDGTQLPDGRLLMLNRTVTVPGGFSAKLTTLDPAEIFQGKTLTSKELITLSAPLLIDNMEGLTTTQENGRTIIWMISDNNFNAWQRTILMKFALIEDAKKPEADAAPGFNSL